jgi:hypothetical protein
MRRLSVVVLAGALLLMGAAPAMASTRGEIFDDCQDDSQLSGSYSPSDLRDARKHLPSDLREYSDCEDVLRRAELPDPSTGGGNPPSGGSTTPPTTPGQPPSGSGSAGAAPVAPAVPETEQDNKAIAAAQKAGTQPLSVGERTIIPTASGLPGGPKANDLPTALVASLILLALAGLALSIPPLRRRFNLPFGLSRS